MTVVDVESPVSLPSDFYPLAEPAAGLGAMRWMGAASGPLLASWARSRCRPGRPCAASCRKTTGSRRPMGLDTRLRVRASRASAAARGRDYGARRAGSARLTCAKSRR